MEIVTYPFVNIPAAALATLRSLGHSLVRLKVPVKMPRLLLLSFLIGIESATARAAFVTLGIVESVDQNWPRTGNSQEESP